MRTLRRSILTAVVGTAAGAALATSVATSPVPAVVGASVSDRAASTAPMTTVTFEVRNCEGCQVHVQSARTSNYQRVWQAPARRVHDGRVSFQVPTARTRGLSVNVLPTWEEHGIIPTGYETMAVFRYGRTAPGEHVDSTTARTKHQGSACWAGTSRSDFTMRLNIRKVRVQGTGGETDGSIAWFPTTRRYLKPMLPAYQGIVGAQDVVFCGPQH